MTKRKSYLQFATSCNASKPVNTVILVDTSYSMSTNDFLPNRLKGAMEAVEALLGIKKQNRPQDFVSLIGFSSRAVIHSYSVCVSKNYNQLKYALKQLHVESATNYVKGLQAAKVVLDQLEDTMNSLKSITGSKTATIGSERKQQFFQQHIIFLSDGWQNEGGCPLKLCQSLKNSGVIIDCIGIGGAPYQVDERKLKSMASLDHNEQPRYRFIKDTTSLVQHYKKLAIPQVIA